MSYRSVPKRICTKEQPTILIWSDFFVNSENSGTKPPKKLKRNGYLKLTVALIYHQIVGALVKFNDTWFMDWVECVSVCIILYVSFLCVQHKTSSTLQVRALYSFHAEERDELEFNAGDIIEVLESSDKDWWKGKLRGKTGLFPSNYIKPIWEEDTQTSTFNITVTICLRCNLVTWP